MKPIIFSTEMVRAILEGRKTQTRRVVRPQPPDGEAFYGPRLYYPVAIDKDGMMGPADKPIFGISSEGWGTKCPYQPGRVLWVRETWGKREVVAGEYHYKADYPAHVLQGLFSAKAGWRWSPPIYMPKKAARLFLRVTGVRAEYLEEITDSDARAEGIKDGGCLSCGNNEPCGCEEPMPSPVDAFIRVWDSINAKRGYGWNANPLVWVIEFERVDPSEL